MDTSRTTPITTGPLLAMFLVFSPYAAAQPTLTTLHNFTGSPSDGATPYGHLVIGPGRVLYGATTDGGTAGRGAVFSLTPPSEPGGSWSEQVYSFPGGKAGNDPQGGVVIGPGGVLYGTTMHGGKGALGTVFSLRPPASPGGPWTERVLHEFTGSDGANPASGVVIGSDGLLYGTTLAGGASGFGTVYTLTPPASSGQAWTETVICSFIGSPSDGSGPIANVSIGSGGVIYGITLEGGDVNQGTVFSLTPPASPGEGWTRAVLHSFTDAGGDGSLPEAGVVIDSNGLLYGTTADGGSGQGTVYSLTPSFPGEPWTQTVLHSFNRTGDGSTPFAGVVIGSGGVLYGATGLGGAANGGTVFSLTPPASPGEPWTETILYNFAGSDGSQPDASVVIGSDGAIYGTTYYGGTAGFGTVYRLMP